MQVSNQWSLILEDPTTIVQCLHQNFGSSIKNVACYLYYSGIPFHTCITRLHLPSSADNLPYCPLSLGWCSKNHRLTTADYAEYEEMLDPLLHRPYGRAALLQGGIIWCLALLCLGWSEIDVTQGPSINASLLGKVWTLGNGSKLYDDYLSEDEMDVICGVYKIVTGVFFHFISINIPEDLMLYCRHIWTDCGHVLVAKPSHFLLFWTLGMILVTSLWALVSEASPVNSWSHCRAKILSPVA